MIITISILSSIVVSYITARLFFKIKHKQLDNTLIETQRLVGAIHRQIKQNQKRKWAEGKDRCVR